MKKFYYALNQRGFVLIEFVIALPLLIMLLYGLGETSLSILSAAKNQAADYVLEVEAQDALTRITQDLRAASEVEVAKRFSNSEIDTLTIKYHTNKTDGGKIIDLIAKRVYIVDKSYNLQAKRRDDGVYLNPITGGNFFGDTAITYLKYFKIDERVLKIVIEMESIATGQRIKLSTAVFMPACEKMTFN